MKVKDNWGHITYFTKDGAEWRPETGDFVRIEWPDGFQEMAEVIESTTGTTISDMGHDYRVVQVRYYFTLKHFGAELLVDFAKVEVVQ